MIYFDSSQYLLLSLEEGDMMPKFKLTLSFIGVLAVLAVLLIQTMQGPSHEQSLKYVSEDTTEFREQVKEEAFEVTNAKTLGRAVVHVQTEKQAGSGFVVSEEGHILTSAHIVKGYTRVSVWFSNGARRSGTVTARDSALDVAVVKVSNMPVSVQPLDWESAPSPTTTTRVWVWGYPREKYVVEAGFSRAPTVSAGIISALRLREGVRFLQTDAALNPGNSGGPWVTADGRVVGMSFAILITDGEDPEGLNFALSIAENRNRIQKLLSEE